MFINLDKILTNHIKKGGNTSKNGVYCINCEQCNAVYYGQTGRNLHLRVAEHSKIINMGKITGFDTHSIDHKHTFSIGKIKLLNSAKERFRHDLLKNLQIRKGLRK